MSAAARELMLPALRGAIRRVAGSFSSARARPITGSHLFRIDGFKLVHMMVPMDSAVMSDKFHIAGLDWQLSYYPNGLDRYSSFVGIGLHATESHPDSMAAAAAQVSVVDRAGVLAFSRDIQPKDLAPMGRFFGSRFGYKGNFVDKEVLTKWAEHHMDDDDRLHIRCDLVVLQTNTESRIGSYLKDFWRARPSLERTN